MNKKGILFFLVFTFGFGYTAQILMGYFNLIHLSEPNLFQRLFLIAVLFIPAIGAILARSLSHSKLDNEIFRIWPIPQYAAIQAALTVPLFFVLIHLILSVTGISHPQWRMGTLMNTINSMLLEMNQPPMTETVATIAPLFLLVAGFFLSIVLGTTVFAVAALGMEWGWRGFLLPRLLPLGKPRAYLITGALSGLWLLPIVVLYYTEGNSSSPGLLLLFQFMLAAIVLGVLSGEIVTRTGNLGLSCIVIGAFVGQSTGMWSYLFPVDAPPWSGPIGFISLLVWLLLAFKPGILTGTMQDGGAPASIESEYATTSGEAS